MLGMLIVVAYMLGIIGIFLSAPWWINYITAHERKEGHWWAITWDYFEANSRTAVYRLFSPYFIMAGVFTYIETLAGGSADPYQLGFSVFGLLGLLDIDVWQALHRHKRLQLIVLGFLLTQSALSALLMIGVIDFFSAMAISLPLSFLCGSALTVFGECHAYRRVQLRSGSDQ